MIKKILIANRGEIACRVIKTARRMGIETVAIYSDADRNALHCQMADESVHIGGAPVAESYLLIENILAAIKTTNADAVHPGYGFLSENSAFADALADIGVTFIGPSSSAIALMGDKIKSKKLAKSAGVSTVPGSFKAVRSAASAEKIANEIGYPVMLKASAGGGGKGMRLARNAEECREGLKRAVNEAKTAFGDDRIFIEKFIENPRHIEIQIIADTQGNTLYLGERECSIQRRHQKIIEEAPSPFLDDNTRKAMGAEAMALAKAVGYHSAGTVEFVVDEEKNFYFLEMNTRLQVEHPVTEMIIGCDLVELMIKVANGEPLPFTQEEIQINGWAMEARVYAEDPQRNFLPSTGRIVRYKAPPEEKCTRIDTGVKEGDEISLYYDPMIAKLVTHGVDRPETIKKMSGALEKFFIRGVNHNIGFLSTLVSNQRFRNGDFNTNFIADEYPDGFNQNGNDPEKSLILLVVGASIHNTYQQRAHSIGGPIAGLKPELPVDWVVENKDGKVPVTVCVRGNQYSVTVAQNTYDFQTDWRLGDPLVNGSINGEPVCVQLERTNVGYHLSHGGFQDEILVLSPRNSQLNALMPEKIPPDNSKLLLSPMPGMLISLPVKVGQEVKAGEVLSVIEAMKMENVLRADRDVIISQINSPVGESLIVDQVIMEFE